MSKVATAEDMLGDQAVETGASANRPVIEINQGDLPAVIDEVEKVLVPHAETLRIFQRSGQLVEIIRLKAHAVEEQSNTKRLKRTAGTLMLEPLGSARLEDLLDALINFKKFNATQRKYLSVDCPSKIVTRYSKRRGHWKLPVLIGPIAAPLMRLDGTLLTSEGYDKKTGLYLDSECDWLTVPQNPTLKDAQGALEVLRAPFAEFPFVEPEDKGVEIAAILTALERRVLGACPLFGYSAPAPRSGKSNLAEAVAIIATGKPAAASAVSNEKEEFRKALLAILLEGQLIVNLDNIEQPLKSPELCKVITQMEYGDRLLGENKQLCLPTNVMFTATGNNLLLRGDLAQRALVCKIDSKKEKPEERTFEIKDFKAHLLDHRAELVCAALTILRAYHLGENKSEKPLPAWGGFDEWSRFIREPLVWAGETDPCKTRERVVSTEPDMDSSREVHAQLFSTFDIKHFTVNEMLKRANEGVDAGVPMNRELYEALLAVAGDDEGIDVRRIGWWMRKWRDRIISGMAIVRANAESAKPALWRVEKSKNDQ